MKKVNAYLGIVAIIATAVLYYFHFFSGQQVVYIDTNVLLEEYYGMADAQAEYSTKASEMNAQVDTLMNMLENDIKAYEKERSGMSEKERELKEELLRNKQYQMMQYQEATKRKLADEEQVATQTVLNEVNDYINEYGKKHGYRYILGANGSGNLVYAEEAYNITEQVLEGLNSEYKMFNKEVPVIENTEEKDKLAEK
ncbi:MAG: OmpH family outer membrane protein [Bacteroidota bacterium]